MSSPFLIPALDPVPGNLFSNGLAVGIIAILHIQFAAYLNGASTLAVVSEAISMARNDPRHEHFAHGLIKSSAYVFTLGSAIAIFWVLFILMGLWALFFVALTRITFWVFVYESGAFFVEIALLYTVYAAWDRLRPYRRARFGLLLLLMAVLWWQMFLINIVASYMLTPNGGDVNQLGQVLNPTFLPLQLHRTVGNIAWGGAVVGFYAGLRYLLATRQQARAAERQRLAPAPARSVGAMSASHFEQEQAAAEVAARNERLAYWDWMGSWGVLWAIGLSLFQIWIGYSYAKEVQLHAYAAWYRMMWGELSNVFLTQIFLLGMIFILGCLYFWRRMRAAGIRRLWVQKFCFVILVLAMLLAIQPAWFALSYGSVASAHLDRAWWDGGLLNPIGNFIPFKVIALTAMMIFGLISLTSYLRAYAEGWIVAGQTTRRLQVVLLTLGVTVSIMLAVMGVIRENSRQPYLINGELRTQHQEITSSAPQPGTASAPQVQVIDSR